MRLALITVVLVGLGGSARGQARVVEIGAHVESLSGTYADGSGASLAVSWPRPHSWLRAEAALVDRLGDRAGVGGIAGGRDVGRWVVQGSTGASTAGMALPRHQVSVGVGCRWGARRQALTTITASYREARDVHRDVDLAAEVVLYGARAVAQGGARLTLSQPGDALGGGAYVAVTVGDLRGRHVTGRLSVGREAYLLVEPAPLDVAFSSGSAQIGWHEPVGRGWGAAIRADLAVNPYYTQLGVRTAVTRRF